MNGINDYTGYFYLLDDFDISCYLATMCASLFDLKCRHKPPPRSIHALR